MNCPTENLFFDSEEVDQSRIIHATFYDYNNAYYFILKSKAGYNCIAMSSYESIEGTKKNCFCNYYEFTPEYFYQRILNKEKKFSDFLKDAELDEISDFIQITFMKNELKILRKIMKKVTKLGWINSHY